MSTAIALKRRYAGPTVRTVALIAAVMAFAALCVLPVIYMIGASFTGADGTLTVDNYRRLLADARSRELLVNSALLGTGTALVATSVGGVLGLLLSRVVLPAKRFLRLGLIVPLVIPPYILALSWTYIGGPTGLVTQLFGVDWLSDWTYSLPGAIAVLSAGFYPLPMLATEAAASRVDGRLEEAALLLTRPSRVLWRITLPLIAPTVGVSALVVFVLAISEFGVPGLLRVRVFTTEVFTAFAALYDFGAATALAVPLIVLVLLAGITAELIIGKRLIAGLRRSRPGLKGRLLRSQAIALISITLVLCLCVCLPLVVLAREAGTLQRIIGATSSSAEAIWNSLLLAALGASFVTILATLLGYGRSRIQGRAGPPADLTFIIIFAVPSTVVGIGLIGLWNRADWRGVVYSSSSIIIVAYLARFVSVASLIIAAGMRQVPKSFEEAAEVAGAGWPRTFTRIVVPQIKPAVAAAWVVSFVLAFGELGATILVAPPGESTLPVRIYTLIANTTSSEVAGLALMQTCIVLIPLAALGMFAGRGGKES